MQTTECYKVAQGCVRAILLFNFLLWRIKHLTASWNIFVTTRKGDLTFINFITQCNRDEEIYSVVLTSVQVHCRQGEHNRRLFISLEMPDTELFRASDTKCQTNQNRNINSIILM